MNRRSRCLFVLFCVLMLLLASGPVAAAGQSLADVTVVVEPSEIALDLGESADLTVTITNATDQTLADVVAHIDITALDSETSVDPEDWTATLSRPLGPLEPGQSTSVVWTVQPIAPGEFTLYAVVLAPGAPNVASSNVLTVSVADRRSLNPNGILPVSVGMPIVIGGLLITQHRRNRRGRTSRPRSKVT